MITMTFRMDKKRVLACLLAAAVLMGGGRLLSGGRVGEALVTDAATAPVGKISTRARSPEERLAFISAYGWEVEPEPFEIREVVIPREFDEVFEKYNFLQKQQGFDLAKQRGRRCKRYTYNITNYPGGVENVRLNMLVYKNKVVGGDVSTASLDGFMHGFDIASATTWLSVPEYSAPVQGGTAEDEAARAAAVAGYEEGQFPVD